MNLECDEIVIIPKPEHISWENVTKLLNLAYAERLEQGLNYSAATQNVTDTIKRCKGAVCLVALYNNKLIGTITYRILNKENNSKGKWYSDESYILFTQFAVDPVIKKKGVGSKLLKAIETIGSEHNVDSIICDTAFIAENLLKWYYRIGFEKVYFTSHSATNYYSIGLRKPISGKKYNFFYKNFKYSISKIKCIIVKKVDGHYRLPFQIIKRII